MPNQMVPPVKQPTADEIRAAQIRAKLIAAFRLTLSASAMTDGQKAQLAARLWNMIQYAIGRHDYWDNYRTRYLTIATALLAVSATAVSILVNAKIADLGAYLLYAAFIALGGTGLYLVYRFRKDTSPKYPYREVSDVKSWIHLYTLPPGEKDFLDMKSRPARDKAVKIYLDGLESFSDKWWRLSEEERMQEDLEQVFILYTLQAYKRAFATRMAAALQVGIALFLVLLAGAFLVYLAPHLLSMLPHPSPVLF